MKREALKALGLTDEQIDSVMSEHGKTMSPLRVKLEEAESSVTNLNAQIKERDTDLNKLKASAKDNEELQTQLKDLQATYKTAQTEYETNTAALKKENSVKLALHDISHDTSILLRELDLNKVSLGEDGAISGGLEEQVKALKEAKGFLFKEVAAPDADPKPNSLQGTYVPPNGKQQQPGAGDSFLAGLNG